MRPHFKGHGRNPTFVLKTTGFLLTFRPMGYVFDFKDAKRYESWFDDPQFRLSAELEGRLMLDMLRPAPGETALEIGVGTGRRLCALMEMGVNITGIDPSPYMLDIARKRLGRRADLHRGFGEDLPFDDNAFHYVIVSSTLEFADNPKAVLEEAFRTAKDRVFIGVMNRFAIQGIRRRVEGLFQDTIYSKARFFSVWEIKSFTRELLGDVPITWRTICHFPSSQGVITSRLERSDLVRKTPFGAFAGVVVTPAPHFRTRPMVLRRSASPVNGRPVEG